MVCSMVKKGLVGAALGAGALFLVFGTHAPSYVKTAFHKMRQNAKDAVPVQFDIDRAREEITKLEPAIRDNIETLARAEVEAESLDKEIAQIQTNLTAEKKAMLALRDSLKTGDFRLAGHFADTADEVKVDLSRRYDHFKNVSLILQEKETTLKSKRKTIQAANQQLENMRATKKTLLTKLAGIEARLKMIEATQQQNEFNFDGSSLARAKESVSELEKRLDVMARTAALEGRYAESESLVPTYVTPGRDVVKEIDAEFNKSTPGTDSKPTGKSL